MTLWHVVCIFFSIFYAIETKTKAKVSFRGPKKWTKLRSLCMRKWHRSQQSYDRHSWVHPAAAT